jgi:ribosomal protein S18 acetylase RimI-like enzyme
VNEALRWARENGYEQVILETTPQQKAAVALYEACGFALVAETMFGRWQLAWFGIGLDGS